MVVECLKEESCDLGVGYLRKGCERDEKEERQEEWQWEERPIRSQDGGLRVHARRVEVVE